MLRGLPDSNCHGTSADLEVLAGSGHTLPASVLLHLKLRRSTGSSYA